MGLNTLMKAHKYCAITKHIRLCAIAEVEMCFSDMKHIMRWHKAHSLDDICDLHASLYAVLANERTQIRSDPVPGLSVDTLGGYRVGNAVTCSESDTDRAGRDGGKTRPG